MKIHRYQLKVYASEGNFFRNEGQIQNRLYIPGEGIVGYMNESQIDFFSDDYNEITQVEKSILKKLDCENGFRYLEEIELPDSVVLKVISDGKSLNESREKFKKSVRELVDLIKQNSV